MTNLSQHTGARDKLLILAAICLSALVLPLSFTGGAVARWRRRPLAVTWAAALWR